jgi:hypothetical protein
MPTLKLLVKNKSNQNGALRCLVFSLILAAILCLVSVSPVSADVLLRYYNIIYGPVTFDKSEIIGGDVFHAYAEGRVICIKSLPMTVKESVITSRIVAVHAISGIRLVINPDVVFHIKPFPCKKDETFVMSQVVPLQFPAQAEQGDYNIICQFVEAKIKMNFWWDVSKYLPHEQSVGTVRYFVTQPQTIPAPQPLLNQPTTSLQATSPTTSLQATPPTTSPQATLPTTSRFTTPSSAAPPPAQNLATNPAPESQEHIVPCWAILVIFAAIGTIGIFIIRWLRHRPT